MKVDLGRSITYAFEDQHWLNKVGLLFVIGFIPGLNVMAWSGYALSIARNQFRRATFPLPAWDQWSDIFVRGFLSIMATAIYWSPVLLIGCVVLAASFVVDSSSGLVVSWELCIALGCVIYLLAANLILTVGHVRYAQTDQFSSYLELGARLRDLQRQPDLYLLLFSLQLIISVIAVSLAALLAITCLGAFAILTLAFLVNGYVLGSATLSTRK